MRSERVLPTRQGGAVPTARGTRGVDTYGFHPSCESPRFLLASACHRTEIRQRNGHIVYLP